MRRLLLTALLALPSLVRAGGNTRVTAAGEGALPGVAGAAGQGTQPVPLSLPAPTLGVDLPPGVSPTAFPAQEAAAAALPAGGAAALPAAETAGKRAEAATPSERFAAPEVLAPDGALTQAVDEVSQAPEGAVGDAGLNAVFSGARKPGPVSALEGVQVSRGWFTRDSLSRGGVRLEVLGSGQFGVVHVDPGDPDVVLKAVDPNADVALFTAVTISQAYREEVEISRALSDSGAGPRYLGSAVVSGRPIVAKERVHGETLEKIIRERRFTKEDYALVMEMTGRLAQARLVPDDMRPPNIMIGTTRSDPARRAYLIDAIKEAVDGARVSSLIARGRFGAAERRQVDELLAMAGEPPLVQDDPREERIMVGTVQKEYGTRAYFVDSDGNRLMARPWLSLEEAREALRVNPVVVKVMGNMMQGTAQALYRPFHEILDEGLVRASRTRWWQVLWDGIAEAFSNMQLPAK